MKKSNIVSTLAATTALVIFISNPVNAGGGVPGFQASGVPGAPQVQASGVPGAPKLQASGVPGSPKLKSGYTVNSQRFQASGVPGKPFHIK